MAAAMSGPGHEPEEASSVLARACLLVSEAHALTYALVMVLSSTPREEFTQRGNRRAVPSRL